MPKYLPAQVVGLGVTLSFVAAAAVADVYPWPGQCWPPHLPQEVNVLEDYEPGQDQDQLILAMADYGNVCVLVKNCGVKEK